MVENARSELPAILTDAAADGVTVRSVEVTEPDLEVFSPTVRRVAHITPQAWGNDAFAKLVGHGASIAGILPQLGILAAYAVVLLALAAWRLRRVLSA